MKDSVEIMMKMIIRLSRRAKDNEDTASLIELATMTIALHSLVEQLKSIEKERKTANISLN